METINVDQLIGLLEEVADRTLPIWVWRDGDAIPVLPFLDVTNHSVDLCVPNSDEYCS
jgi:hypothetical protein